MIRVGVHWDPERREEWLVLRVKANWLQWAHAAAYVGTRLAQYAFAFLPVYPVDVRIMVHDLIEPALRRGCERRPSKWVRP